MWAFGPLAVANFIDTRQMAAEVVAESPGEVVDTFFFDQAIGGVVGELVSGIVFVDQCGEANGLVVVVANALAFGVLAARRQAPRRS